MGNGRKTRVVRGRYLGPRAHVSRRGRRSECRTLSVDERRTIEQRLCSEGRLGPAVNDKEQQQ